ncbi:MAG: polyphosphate polymerase domain-containing protein [Verrucomicrobia bacterium]|nr:polyphosphate polymerase domain-containing protein [Verrucomicrobiota bacterium]
MSPATDTRENREFASEIKFLVTLERAEQIRAWVRARLAPDPYAGGANGDGYQITSLYFDTVEFAVFHRRGSYGRSKYRIRRYGQGEVAFLERKLKTRGLLTKRRSSVELTELERLSAEAAVRGWVGSWFHRRLLARGLNPVCQISYRRTARVAMTDYGPIRLTLDDDLRALPAAGLWFSEQESRLILENSIILEMKFRHGMPALFKYVVEEFALIPSPFSKYRQAATALGLVSVLPTDTRAQLDSQYA